MLFNASKWSGLLVRRGNPSSGAALEYPLSGAERIAVIGARLRAERRVRSYVHWRTAELEAWRPQALAGHRSELFAIGDMRQRQVLQLPDLAFPLLVLSSLREGPLSSDEHDQLWALYGLPVYEQIRSADETLLGWECDARDGWHLPENAGTNPALTLDRVLAAGWQCRELDDRCACGEACLRLVVEARESVLSMASAGD